MSLTPYQPRLGSGVMHGARTIQLVHGTQRAALWLRRLGFPCAIARRVLAPRNPI
jgi:hypothetical protein